MTTSIGAESPEDAFAVEVVLRRAFGDQPGVAVMVAAIRESPEYEPGLALVAKRDRQVLGFVMLSHAELADDLGGRHDVLTLSPLAVDPAHARRGIGSSLVLEALRRAEARADLPRLVVLEGDPQFYGRLGFEFAPTYGVRVDLPGWAPPEAAQVYRLTGCEPDMRGRMIYPAAFSLA